MTDQSTGAKDFERVLGKAAVEAARTASQASQVAKRIIGEMTSEAAESKGYDTPAIDLMDTNDEIIAFIALPGVSKDMIDLRITEDTLSIDAKATPREGRYLRRDLSPNGFKREIKLPAEIKPEAVRASYQNGILEVHLPKLVVVNAQRVQVD
ncbi:MAG: Hsp20/alpha crystallin family protein [Methanotrichaceae archaeon]